MASENVSLQYFSSLHKAFYAVETPLQYYKNYRLVLMITVGNSWNFYQLYYLHIEVELLLKLLFK
jgi:hypothetical protein